MVCRSPTCPCNHPDPDGTNQFLLHLANASWAIESNQPRLVQSYAELGAGAFGWKHAMNGLQKALKEHPADYVPAYMRKDA